MIQAGTRLNCPSCSFEMVIPIETLVSPSKNWRCGKCKLETLKEDFVFKSSLEASPTEDNETRTKTMPRLTTNSTPKVTDNEKLNLTEELKKLIVGQDHVLDEITSLVYRWEVGLSPQGAPAGTLLLLGPTGSGKTSSVEALSQVLFGSDKSFLKIDCAEFSHSHEIAKLLGSPPGYLGHRETSPALTQENLNRHWNDKYKCSILLLDEIEKASDALWNLLLGIMDKATLTLGDNRKIDFSNTFVFMTSNLGAREMASELAGAYGYGGNNPQDVSQSKLDDIALSAAKKRFNPEFLNRIDLKLVYRTLTKDNLNEILEQILTKLQLRLFAAKGPTLHLQFAPDVKEYLLNEGFSKAYGARELKRAVERLVSIPLVRAIRDDKLKTNDVRVVMKEGRVTFK